MITDALHPAPETAYTFGSLISGADLVVIKSIIFSDINRGEVRHDHIGAGQDSFFTAVWIDRSKCRGGRKQQMVVHQAQDADHVSSEVRC